GIMVMAKSIASEYAEHGITANALAPALIDTDMIAGLADLTAAIPVGRLGRPDEVAGVVAYLCSTQAAYITGEVVDVNGGFLIDCSAVPLPETMQVAELPGVGQPLRLAERPIPEPGPGGAVIRAQACGVCGSDVFLQDGGFGGAVRYPVVPGHEAAGVVAALGPGVTAVSPGEQVAIYYIDAPADSIYARRGRPNIGPRVVRMGVDVDGAFAEYVVRPASTLVRVPEPVDPPTLAVLTDAVGTPYHALVKIAKLQRRHTLPAFRVP